MYIDNIKQIFHIVYKNKIIKDLFYVINYMHVKCHKIV